jgi:site-specific DNA-methyltransferase (adenine-specific)
MAANLLYYGDNLAVLRRHVADGSVDLVYLDPPLDPREEGRLTRSRLHGSSMAGGQLRPAVATRRPGPGG